MKPSSLRLHLLAPLLVASLAFTLPACTSQAPDANVPPATEGPVVEQPAPDAPEVPGTETTPVGATPACSPLVPRTTPLEVWVLPDAGATPFVSVLARAAKTIRVMVYEIGT